MNINVRFLWQILETFFNYIDNTMLFAFPLVTICYFGFFSSHLTLFLTSLEIFSCRVDELKTQLKETEQEKEELKEKIAFKENELVVNDLF